MLKQEVNRANIILHPFTSLHVDHSSYIVCVEKSFEIARKNRLQTPLRRVSQLFYIGTYGETR
jgi:hypothetical protein